MGLRGLRVWLDGGVGGGAVGDDRLGLLLEEGGNAVDDFVEAGARTEAGQSFELIDAGDAAHHVFEAGLVGLVVRDVFDRGAARGALLDAIREAFDA